MFKKQLKKRVLFVGIPDMAYVCLDGLNMSGINIVGIVGPKKDHPTYSDFKKFVKLRNLNFIDYDRLDDVFFIQKIRDLKADIAVVCSFNYKIPKILLDSVKDGFINVHPSLLPDYRGSNPYSPVIFNDENETGVTLHFMDENFDTGDIIIQKRLAVSKLETMGTLFNRLNLVAFDMLLETLKKYETNTLSREKQPEGKFKRGVFPEEAALINYEKQAYEIESLIRALNPFITARTTFRGTIVRVLSAEVVDENTHQNNPCGSIVRIENDRFYVKTGKGLLAITSMQFGSFFAGTSKEFIQILNPRIGERFS